MKNYQDEYIQTAIIILVVSFFVIICIMYFIYKALGVKIEKK